MPSTSAEGGEYCALEERQITSTPQRDTADYHASSSSSHRSAQNSRQLDTLSEGHTDEDAGTSPRPSIPTGTSGVTIACWICYNHSKLSLEQSNSKNKNKKPNFFIENQNGSISPKLNQSRESIASAVRLRRLRRLERPLSLADAPTPNVLFSLLQNKSYSINFDETTFHGDLEGKERSVSTRQCCVASSHSTDELGANTATGEPRRAVSLIDILLRRKHALRLTCHVIENPMHAALDDYDADTG